MRAADKTGPVAEFFKTVSVAQVRKLLKRFHAVKSETVKVETAAGRVVARTIRSPIDMPHFARSGMDGYAVRAEDTLRAGPGKPVELRLVGSVEMGGKPRFSLKPGTAARISTGGMMPAGANAMVMREYCTETAPRTVAVYRRVKRAENVITVGEDVRRGEIIFQPRRRLRAQDLGALTGVGITSVRVYRRPRVAVIATGDEIVPPEARPKQGQVRDINHYSLRAMIETSGGEPVDFGVIRDDSRAIGKALRRALSGADLVAVSGGSSVGTKDLTLQVIEALPRASLLVHGIAIKPGKPTIVATAKGKPILGLPGHPVSALVVFGLFGVPLLRILGGEDPEVATRLQPSLRATLCLDLHGARERESYVRVSLKPKGEGWVATPLKGGSSAIFSLARADGMVRVPLGCSRIRAGSEVEVTILG